jgi:arsenate reductase
VDETENQFMPVAYSENDTIYLFSKNMMIPANPESDFAAIMTCSQADERLPIDHWC